MDEYSRPDEKSSRADIERSKNTDRNIKSGLKTAGNIALSTTGAGTALKAASPLASKVLPFINKYIPTDLAIKGISKVSPELGNFLKKGMSKGLDLKDGFDFIKSQIEGPAKQSGNIIEQYSPELHQFISEKVKGGHSPVAVANLANKDKKFADIIKKLAKDHKTDWLSIVQSIYGDGEADAKQAALGKFKEHQKKQGLVDQETERLQQGYADVLNPPHSTPTKPPSAEQQAFTRQSNPAIDNIMQALQAAAQMRQKRQGP